MICTECGFENMDDFKFCGGCGAELPDDGAFRNEPSADGSSVAGRAHRADDGTSGTSRPDFIGPYEIRGELGRGAMARVWRAWDPNLGREVAIKEPLFDAYLESSVREEMSSRFVKEAKTAARLNHPGIVTIYAADVYEGRPAIVMELVEGATLGDLLEHGPLDPTATLDALDQLLDAVAYAHEEGVIHRDIKPDNVFVSDRGRVKLADFGIAHVDDAAVTRATVVGSVLGTPGYMSPEQATGSSVDSRSDLFSIGVIAYEMLSGHNPFGAGSGSGSDMTTLLYRIVHEPVPNLPESTRAGLPTDVRPAIMAALSKDPNDRPQTASDFKAMLHGGFPTGTHNTYSAQGNAGLRDSVEQRNGRSTPKWLPYIIVAAIGVVVLAVVLVNALSGSSGGGGSTDGASASYSPSPSASSAVYLAVKDGKVAIFTNSSSAPYETSDVPVSDLPDDIQEELDEHVGFSTVEEAQERVSEYADVAEQTREAMEEQAKEAAASAESAAKASAQAAQASTMYVVNCNEFITLRSGPSTSASEIDRIPLGASVTFLGTAADGFSEVSYEGQRGYALSSYLSSSSQNGGRASVLMRVVNCEEWVTLRDKPDTAGATLDRIPLGESVRYIAAAANGFYQVSYNGQVGYVLEQYLALW